MPTDSLFSEVFLEADDTRISASSTGGGGGGTDTGRRLTNVDQRKKGKKPGLQLHNKTKDEKEICRNWNNGHDCKDKDKCTHAHVCRICFKTHPMKECPDRKKE